MSRNFELLEQLDKERRGAAADYREERDLTTPAALRPNRGTRTYAELNKLVQRLFLSGPTPSRHVVFTGAGPGVGCTWICVHTTKVLCSQTAGSVCLVDTNTSSSSVREHFNLPNGPGFFEALVQDGPIHAFTQKVGNNLWVVPADGSPATAVVRSRQRVEARLLELWRQFDYVLFDAPPAAGSSGSLTLATLADGVVLVLKAGHTRRHAVRLVIGELESTRVKVLGTVLNQREYPIPDPIYKRL